jgi:dTDP-4-dehydrorhamnose 3,5-epimerase-like enzyme
MDPIFFESNSNSDERGTVSFTNDLNLQKAIRTYKVENSQLKTVRAWHGHKVEEKWVNVEQGEFLVCVVKVERYKLSR